MNPEKRNTGNLWVNEDFCPVNLTEVWVRLFCGYLKRVWTGCRVNWNDTNIKPSHIFPCVLLDIFNYYLISLCVCEFVRHSRRCTNVGIMWSSTRRIRPNGCWYATSTLWWNTAHCCRYAALCVCVYGLVLMFSYLMLHNYILKWLDWITGMWFSVLNPFGVMNHNCISEDCI